MEFFGTLFGWSFNPNTERYLLFNDGEQGLGGGFSLDREPATGSGPVLFIEVAGLEQKLELIRQLGGNVVQERMHVGPADTGFGWYAAFDDPHGNRIGLFTTNAK